ncbi:hypothetical protein GF369_04190 [Candidatus Peregrinibacteria bacterium]|nr:hypothetical protein [Candidatus Peregrinibacteria bacterium]
MALSDILEKIKEETDAKMKDLNEQFEAKLSTLEADFEKKKENAKKEMDEQVARNSKKILNKMETVAKMEAKNKLLKEKRELLDTIFSQALEALVKEDEYQNLITTLLKKTTIEEDGVRVIPAKGKEDETKKALEESGKKYTMADKSADIQGGFILQSEKIEVDNSFESILHKQLRDDLELDIAKMLFPA